MLYLKGSPFGPGPAPARWRSVVCEFRRTGVDFGGLPDALRSAGLWSEAIRLETPGLRDWAERLMESKRVVTAEHDGFPPRWGALGSSTPPALWCSGPVPDGPWMGVAGSRRPSAPNRRALGLLVEEIGGCGYGVCSGGAIGVDRVAVSTAIRLGLPTFEVLPCGLARAPRALSGVVRLSPFGPSEGFSTANAMVRNTLLYAVGEIALAVQPRLREGGTWHGAAECLRRRLSALLVVDLGNGRGALALEALGARRVGPLGLRAALEEPAEARRLFA